MGRDPLTGREGKEKILRKNSSPWMVVGLVSPASAPRLQVRSPRLCSLISLYCCREDRSETQDLLRSGLCNPPTFHPDACASILACVRSRPRLWPASRVARVKGNLAPRPRRRPREGGCICGRRPGFQRARGRCAPPRPSSPPRSPSLLPRRPRLYAAPCHLRRMPVRGLCCHTADCERAKEGEWGGLSAPRHCGAGPC